VFRGRFTRLAICTLAQAKPFLPLPGHCTAQLKQTPELAPGIGLHSVASSKVGVLGGL
jgi:hypothetical protein